MLRPRHDVPDEALERNSAALRAEAEAIAYEMAYGLSHELNNPLANIAGRARLLAEQEPDPNKRQQLAVIVDQAMRGCEMIADLMLFARPPHWHATELDLSSLLRDLFQRAQKAAAIRQLNVALDIDSDLSPPSLYADRQAVIEAIWAVVRNAIEAAESSIVMRLQSAGDRWIVTVLDDGPGLSPQALSHLFHPYFSGREAGRGLGLGLSKAERIMSLCGGRINIGNQLPKGCRAILEFPVVRSGESP